MQALKFKSKIQETGVIKIPELEKYTGKKVEIIILLNEHESETDKFIKKWSGFITVKKNDKNDKNSIR